MWSSKDDLRHEYLPRVLLSLERERSYRSHLILKEIVMLAFIK